MMNRPLLLLVAICVAQQACATSKPLEEGTGGDGVTQGGTGQALWSQACDHVNDLVRASMAEIHGQQTEGAAKEELDRVLSQAGAECRVYFKGQTPDAADRVARCMIGARSPAEVGRCIEPYPVVTPGPHCPIDLDLPMEEKVEAMIELGGDRGAGALSSCIALCSEPRTVAAAVAGPLGKKLETGDLASQTLAWDCLHGLLEWLDGPIGEPAREALGRWVLGALTGGPTGAKHRDLVGPRAGLELLRRLGAHAVPVGLLMVEQRPESDTGAVADWLDFMVYLDESNQEAGQKGRDAAHHATKALEALKRYHLALFKAMETDVDLYFNPNDVILVEKVEGPRAVEYLLELARHPKVDPATQYTALLISEAMLEEVVPEEEMDHLTDRLLAVIVNKLPEIRSASGKERKRQVRLLLEKTGIPGLEKVPLAWEVQSEGRKETRWKPYLASDGYRPGGLVIGLAGDFLGPLVEKERAGLALAPRPGLKLPEAVDRKVTPLVASWLDSDLTLPRLFGVAGLTCLGTPRATELLRELAGDERDISGYLGEGMTLGMMAGNGLEAIDLARDFEQLKLDVIQAGSLSPEAVTSARDDMLADIGLKPGQLATKHGAALKNLQKRHRKHKRKK